MILDKVLPAGSVVLDFAAPDKAAVIAHLSSMLAAAASVPPALIETALLAREALGSTGVGSGVALPHARLHVLSGTHAVFLRLAAPVNFDSIDGRHVDLVCGVVAPDEPNAALLTAVAAVSRVLRDAATTAGFREARDAEEVRRGLVEGRG
ncbi:MAG: PTS sugar transporter subunit IIA [Candidatus Binatia bacterium]